MNAKISPWLKGLDAILYWLIVAVLLIGIFSAQLIPPKLDVVVFAGLIFSCFVLKPMVATKLF